MIPSLLPPSSESPATRALNAAEAAVRRYCGWHIAPVITQELVLDSPGVRTVFLPSLKVLNITEFSVCGVTQNVDALEWSENGFVRSPRVFPDRLRGISVTFEHGFESVHEVAQIVQAIADRDLASPKGVVRERAGQVSVDYSQVAPGVAGGVALLAHEMAILDKYRLSLRGA